jgi:hypothetical protein
MTSVAGAKAHHVLTRDAALKGQLFHRRGERSSCEAKGRPSWEACSLAGRHGVESEVPRQLESMAEVVPRVLQHCGRVRGNCRAALGWTGEGARPYVFTGQVGHPSPPSLSACPHQEVHRSFASLSMTNCSQALAQDDQLLAKRSLRMTNCSQKRLGQDGKVLAKARLLRMASAQRLPGHANFNG